MSEMRKVFVLRKGGHEIVFNIGEKALVQHRDLMLEKVSAQWLSVAEARKAWKKHVADGYVPVWTDK